MDEYRALMEAGELIDRGELEAAERILTQLIMQGYNEAQLPLSPDKTESIADAEEYLAIISLRQGNPTRAFQHTYNAVITSQRFRATAHFLAAIANERLGDIEMAVTKLSTIIEMSHESSLKDKALEQIHRLRGKPTGEGPQAPQE